VPALIPQTAEAADLHDRDFYAWSQHQAEELRRAARSRISPLTGLDWQHLADEVEELGMSKLDELFSRYKVVVLHLLKWKYQPDQRTNHWRATVDEQRYRIARALRKSPSLRPKRAEEFRDAYHLARTGAADETELPLSAFPETCPFTLDQVEDDSFWPD
jgi:hypothetical protein